MRPDLRREKEAHGVKYLPQRHKGGEKAKVKRKKDERIVNVLELILGIATRNFELRTPKVSAQASDHASCSPICSRSVMVALSRMDQRFRRTSCSVCHSDVAGPGEICQDCHRAFEHAFESGSPMIAAPPDFEKYGAQMFPWEQMTVQPRLISLNPVWLALAILLIVFVLLLAFLRTPLPSCWEISS